ncbi:transglycosylase SLT domain-containing protein [Chitinivorax sp. B]|uniref:lytic transglycosylase domain-containing protein n=1 Tax=Chitinivorax sp. B TaxID=2502235 RepID=UPI0010F9381F|nr:transglycosylase SLT domain-containing protein [Chitinivorax sp. B]
MNRAQQKLILLGAIATAAAVLLMARKVKKGEVIKNDGFIFDIGSLFGVAFNVGDVMPGEFSTAISTGKGKAYSADLERIGASHGLPNLLLSRIAYQESRFRDDIISGKTKSARGAIGMFQFMPRSVVNVSKNLMGLKTPFDPTDWRASANAAAVYLRYLYAMFKDWKKAIAAYNWGEGSVAKNGLATAPSETRNYYTAICRDVFGETASV